MWVNVHDDSIDKFDWRLASGNNKWGISGPQVDHTYGTDKGHYALFDVSGGSKGDNAQMNNIPFMSTFKCLTFWYHMSGKNIGTLRVILRHTIIGPDSDRLLWTLSGPQTEQDIWKQAQVPFVGFDDEAIVLEGIRGSGNQGDIAVDDIYLDGNTCDDIIPAEAKPSTSTVQDCVLNKTRTFQNWIQSHPIRVTAALLHTYLDASPYTCATEYKITYHFIISNTF
ncbi:MAM domain-containing glycosylphosphatidylinositol anchor protein 1-like [Glandiceps talaboti]